MGTKDSRKICVKYPVAHNSNGPLYRGEIPSGQLQSIWPRSISSEKLRMDLERLHVLEYISLTHDRCTGGRTNPGRALGLWDSLAVTVTLPSGCLAIDCITQPRVTKLFRKLSPIHLGLHATSLVPIVSRGCGLSYNTSSWLHRPRFPTTTTNTKRNRTVQGMTAE